MNAKTILNQLQECAWPVCFVLHEGLFVFKGVDVDSDDGLHDIKPKKKKAKKEKASQLDAFLILSGSPSTHPGDSRIHYREGVIEDKLTT